MNRQQNKANDYRLMMAHAVKTGKTIILGESKAIHPAKLVQDKKDFPKGNSFTAKNHKNRIGGDE
jgi:hypothetical protein